MTKALRFKSFEDLLTFINRIEPNAHGCKLWPGLEPRQYPMAYVRGIGSFKVVRVLLDPEGYGRKTPDKPWHSGHRYGSDVYETRCVAIEHLYRRKRKPKIRKAVRWTLESVYAFLDGIQPDEQGCKFWITKTGSRRFHVKLTCCATIRMEESVNQDERTSPGS
jgi:hypothetical protein